MRICMLGAANYARVQHVTYRCGRMGGAWAYHCSDKIVSFGGKSLALDRRFVYCLRDGYQRS